MRIIAGKWRSRRILMPGAETTRPMPDRVKEAVFSILGTRYGTPGTLPPISVADVFAGSGTMGLEALSRGAARCVFFERGASPLVVLRKNLDALEAGPMATIVGRDAWRSAFLDAVDGTFDLIFLDPPYRDSLDDSASGKIGRYLEKLADERYGSPLVVLHHQKRARYDISPCEAWRIEDQRRFGSNGITVFAR